MHDPTYLRRTASLLRGRLGVAALFAAGVITTLALRPTRAPVIEVRQPAAIHQTTVLPFAVPSVIVLPAPPPPPALEPEIAVAPPRALVPMINSSCLLGGSCDWDDGFPAISADGTLIAIKYIPDDGGRGYAGMSIQLINAKTSHVVTTYMVLSPDEYLEPEDAGLPKLQAKIVKRTAIAQRALDAKKFRSLTKLGDALEEGMDPDEMLTPAAPLRAERIGDAVRLIDNTDPAAGTVIWQRRFPVEAEYPQAAHDPEQEGCYPSSTRAVTVAWDPTTRTVLAETSYASGPCYCGDEIKYYVTRL
jgi:hypothetical protein